MPGDHGPSFLGKGAPYEAGIRVPLLMRWRAALGAAETIDAQSVAITKLQAKVTLLEAGWRRDERDEGWGKGSYEKDWDEKDWGKGWDEKNWDDLVDLS